MNKEDNIEAPGANSQVSSLAEGLFREPEVASGSYKDDWDPLDHLKRRRASLDISIGSFCAGNNQTEKCSSRRMSVGAVPSLRQNLLRRSLCSSINNLVEAGVLTAYFDDEEAVQYDPSRRVSFGGESLAEYDIQEDIPSDSDYLCDIALLGAEYSSDIYELKKKLVPSYHPVKSLSLQKQISEPMRCTVVNWLTKVNAEFKFCSETLFVGVNLFDRFLAVAPIASDCLQLLAMVSLFVASKMEENQVPSVSILVALCGPVYQKHHFLRMEVLLITKLGFSLNSPTAWYFLNYLSMKAIHNRILDRRVCKLANSIAEHSLCHYNIVQYEPSILAAACLFYATEVAKDSNGDTFPGWVPRETSGAANSPTEAATAGDNNPHLICSDVTSEDFSGDGVDKRSNVLFRSKNALTLLNLYEETYTDAEIDVVYEIFELMKLNFVPLDDLHPVQSVKPKTNESCADCDEVNDSQADDMESGIPVGALDRRDSGISATDISMEFPPADAK